ncbi:MAG: diguanylate cyclase [Elusimicrobiota bacterium]
MKEMSNDFRTKYLSLGGFLIFFSLVYFIWRIYFPSKSNPLLFYLLDTVIFILAVTNIYGIIFYLIRPLKQLAQQGKVIFDRTKKDKICVQGKDEISLLTNVFSHLSLEFEKKESELKSYNEQIVSHMEMYQRLKQQFEKKVYDLYTLFDIARDLNSTLNPNTVLQIILLTCLGQMGVTSTVIFWLQGDELLGIKSFKGLTEDQVKDVSLDIHSNLISNLVYHRFVPLQELEPIYGQQAEFQILKKLKCELLVPFIEKEVLKGLLVLGPKLSNKPFTEDDLEFLSTLANLGGLSLENAQLYTMAITDGLTNLYVQRYFTLRLDDEIRRAKRYQHKTSLLMIDIDHFKLVNDTYGHLAGNKVLVEIADVLKKTTRGIDLLSRYGGEEFAVLMPETDRDSAMILAERLRKKTEETIVKVKEGNIKVTISLGLATFPENAGTSFDLIDHADTMLYQAKEGGRNRVCG